MNAQLAVNKQNINNLSKEVTVGRICFRITTSDQEEERKAVKVHKYLEEKCGITTWCQRGHTILMEATYQAFGFPMRQVSFSARLNSQK